MLASIFISWYSRVHLPESILVGGYYVVSFEDPRSRRFMSFFIVLHIVFVRDMGW